MCLSSMSWWPFNLIGSTTSIMHSPEGNSLFNAITQVRISSVHRWSSVLVVVVHMLHFVRFVCFRMVLLLLVLLHFLFKRRIKCLRYGWIRFRVLFFDKYRFRLAKKNCNSQIKRFATEFSPKRMPLHMQARVRLIESTNLPLQWTMWECLVAAAVLADCS